MEIKNYYLPAEWHPQSYIQLTWPHKDTDWAYMLEEVEKCFLEIATHIAQRQPLLLVAPQFPAALANFAYRDNICYIPCPTNDTWARDHGGISVFDPLGPMVYDFVFNGWGMKFAANKDNLITRNLYQSGVFAEEIQLMNMAPFVLEGGSIESDGRGMLMATAECLLSLNRNEYLQREEIEHYLKDVFGVKRILWIENGYLAGDDTDSHVDTLARFCSEDTIAYVKCEDESDEHYDELRAMEEEIKAFRQENGEPYRLVPLPMADEVVWEGERLPATYANFLIINGAVLLPFYNSPKDEEARKALQAVFPDREVIGVNCLPLIKQHGSLHCVTMQYPEGYIS